MDSENEIFHFPLSIVHLRNWWLQTYPQHRLKSLPLLDSSPSGVHDSNLVRSLKPYGGKGGIRTHGTLLRFTAFPVLPVQPLLHLSVYQKFQISNSKSESNESGIWNLESSTVRWRRGWDSNPRNPFGFNGFRDRPIQPLSHLSARTYNSKRLPRIISS
jgi:hypothetical protein